MANNFARLQDSHLWVSLCTRVRLTRCARVLMGPQGWQYRRALSLVALGLLLMATGLLGGCERVVYVDRPVLVAPTVAPSLLHCMPEPAPLPEGARQRDVAPYVLDVLAAGQDCRRKLGTVRAQLEPAPTPAAAAPPEPTP